MRRGIKHLTQAIQYAFIDITMEYQRKLTEIQAGIMANALKVIFNDSVNAFYCKPTTCNNI